MSSDKYVYIVLGPPPSRKTPLQLASIEDLARSRSDVEVRVGETGTVSTRDFIVVNPQDESTGVLTFIDGRLEIRNPDKKTIQWMLDLAEALDARVVDHSLKTYRSPEEKYIHPDDEDARKIHSRRVRMARSKYVPKSPTVAKWIIIGVFIILAIIVSLAVD